MNWFRRVLDRRPLAEKIALVGSFTVVASVVATAAIAHRLAAVSDWTLVAAAAAVGMLLVVWVTHVLLRAHFEPLRELARTMEQLHKGSLRSVDLPEPADPHLRGFSASYRQMLARLDDESFLFSAKLFASIETERMRIGRELHENTNQSLAAALVALSLVQKNMQTCPPETRAQVAGVAELLQHCIEQIKVIVYDLRPSLLDDFGLEPALRWYVKTHLPAEQFTVDCDFEAGQGRLPREVEVAVFRIAQEALVNIQRHARASRIWLRLQTHTGYVALSVADNGQGLPAGYGRPDAGPEAGLGLMSIRERVALLGGTVNLDSAPGRGTRLYVVIPLLDEAA